MPIYEYHCQACGHSCELLEKMSAAPSTDCPACHQSQLQRQVSAPQFQLKGTGWYVTDFKKNGQTAQTSAEKKSDNTSVSSTDTKTSESSTKTE